MKNTQLHQYGRFDTLEELNLARDNLERELNDYELYKDFIKDECSICGFDFVNSWEYYQRNGNTCRACNHVVTEKLRANHYHPRYSIRKALEVWGLYHIDKTKKL